MVFCQGRPGLAWQTGQAGLAAVAARGGSVWQSSGLAAARHVPASWPYHGFWQLVDRRAMFANPAHASAVNATHAVESTAPSATSGDIWMEGYPAGRAVLPPQIRFILGAPAAPLILEVVIGCGLEGVVAVARL